jgi:GT2 family glycosyltransferase
MERFEVIMPCYIISEELFELTKNAIDSLGNVDLIVVDNASLIGGGYLREKATTYIRNNENLGYGKAVNQGLVLAHLGNYIAIANNDIRVSPNWQKAAIKAFDDNVYSCHFRMIPYEEPFSYGDQTWITGKERWCSSSFFVLNKNQPLFLYDEGYLNSYDDYDYWKRVRDAGLMTAYTNKACYQHKDSSTQQLIAQRAENDKKNLEYFKTKWRENPDTMFKNKYPEQWKVPWRPFP